MELHSSSYSISAIVHLKIEILRLSHVPKDLPRLLAKIVAWLSYRGLDVPNKQNLTLLNDKCMIALPRRFKSPSQPRPPYNLNGFDYMFQRHVTYILIWGTLQKFHAHIQNALANNPQARRGGSELTGRCGSGCCQIMFTQLTCVCQYPQHCTKASQQQSL